MSTLDPEAALVIGVVSKTTPTATRANPLPRLALGFRKAGVYAVLVLTLASVVYPLLWLASASLKTDQSLFLHPFTLPKLHALQWRNYTHAWVQGHFGGYFFNSVVITGCTVSLVMLLSAMSAYALSRFTFPGSRPIFFFFLAGLMLPLQQVIIPLFFQMRTLDLLNSRIGLILAYVSLGLPFGVFVMTGFFKTQPASIYESALVDGAGELTAFFRVMLPIARPGLITVAIFTFLESWNEYLVAFMFLSGKGGERARTLPLGLANISLASQYHSDWGVAFAGLVLMLAPTLVLCVALQRYITKGLTAGAVKG